MSTGSPCPLVFPGDDNDLGKIGKEIAFLTTTLKACRNGEIQSTPQDPDLHLFQHLSTLVTTGHRVNAVSGRIEANRIVSVVVTRPDGKDTGGTCRKVTPTQQGRKLLSKWKHAKDNVTFDEHLQEVADILQYITTRANKYPPPTREETSKRIDQMLCFIHRRALPKLAARVENAVRLWVEAPFHAVTNYYRNAASPAHVTSTSFSLNCTAHTDDKLDRDGLGKDTSGLYHVTTANVGKWAAFIDSLFNEIQEVVLTKRSSPSSSREIVLLVDAISTFKMFIEEKRLMSAIFEPVGLEDMLHFQYTNKANKKTPSHNNDKHDEASSKSEPDSTKSLNDDDDDVLVDDDQPEIYNLIGRSAHILRYCRTITAWYEAVQVIVKSAQRYPKVLDIYHVKALPRQHELSESDVSSFKDRYLDYFASMSADSRENALNFLEDRLGSQAAVTAVVKTAQTAMVHAEATAIGLTSISKSGGSFGNVSPSEVQTLFLPSSTKITIAASTKCCRSCTMLAWIMEDYLDVKFVLPGTHATFFPWSPPQGIPLDALKKMRDRLCIVFCEVACSFTLAPTSPASSTIDLDYHRFDVATVLLSDSDDDSDDDTSPSPL